MRWRVLADLSLVDLDENGGRAATGSWRAGDVDQRRLTCRLRRAQNRADWPVYVKAVGMTLLRSSPRIHLSVGVDRINEPPG